MSVSETCRAVIFGCSGLILTPEEEEFFASVNPVGFILFARNIGDPDQVRALTDALRRCVGRPDAPILIDQEGGRVQRMGPPHWPAYPAMRTFGDAWKSDPAGAERMLQDTIARMSRDLVDVGINVNCAPVLDIPQPDASGVIGLRAFSTECDVVSRLASVAVGAFIRNGVVPVVKHLPGHGRARVDSHFDLPVVDSDLKTLESFDFVPFQAVANAPVGMVAHIVYTAIDPENPASLSGKSFATIREVIGFKGVLLSDDISMNALSGSYESRAYRSLNAGCDTILHCNGDMEEMRAVVKGSSLLRPESLLRWQAALAAPVMSSVTPAVTEI
ncbi:beta-N-acetylhexosaminidase [Haematospirillum sp. 15-248]|uniref:beta-N-acetylhexosaminidase n=1 Tax=Haematospirillum sp. 15-248 TaxID=2723107 RepID=UPI001439F031|nr:beta-N-acetylhexosaminidase [Haematospirillum sp. 15-248]NKD86982.1 beta-N-acetylhexosaminidase [Haematospirillum sp. 15-248]